jgi:LysM repeat protein
MMFAISVEELKKANNLQSDQLAPGQKIRIPIQRTAEPEN